MARKKGEQGMKKQGVKQSKVDDRPEASSVTAEGQSQSMLFEDMSSVWENFYAAVSKVVKD